VQFAYATSDPLGSQAKADPPFAFVFFPLVRRCFGDNGMGAVYGGLRHDLFLNLAPARERQAAGIEGPAALPRSLAFSICADWEHVRLGFKCTLRRRCGKVAAP
jgi:hypothetical protein